MNARDIAEAVLELPPEERLELARRIVTGVFAERESAREIAEAVLGIEQILDGTLVGLTEAEFQKALE